MEDINLGAMDATEQMEEMPAEATEATENNPVVAGGDEESPLYRICKEIEAAKKKSKISEGMKAVDLPPEPEDVRQVVVKQELDFVAEMERAGLGELSPRDVALAAMNSELEPILLRLPSQAEMVSAQNNCYL